MRLFHGMVQRSDVIWPSAAKMYCTKTETNLLTFGASARSIGCGSMILLAFALFFHVQT